MALGSIIANFVRPAIALAMVAFHLGVVFIGPPETTYFRGTHLLFGLVLIFLWFPATTAKGRQSALTIAVDALCLAGSVAAFGYIFLELDYFQTRFAYIDPLRPADIAFGTTALLVIVEAVRRTSGLALPLTAIGFMAVGYFGSGLSYPELLDQIYMTSEGILGMPIGVAATYVFLFVVFGGLVEKTGTGKLFMDFALALAGGTAGGPAKVAVISSAMFGTISGSSTANVLTTGAFTIPMMKRVGYKPAFAGAVEAVASTGGQIMPPIMGAAAFVMAEFLGRSYLDIIGFALLPAFLYFMAVYLAVHFEARRTGLKGIPRPDLPRLGAVLRERGHQILPLVVIVAVLAWGYSAAYSAAVGILSVIPVALMRSTTRKDVSLRVIYEGCTIGVFNSLQVTAACACAGIVIGVISLTGLSFEFMSFVVSLSQDSLILALILTAVAGLILGMGLPTTPAYVVQASLLVPALVKLGVLVVPAHMFVFYFAVLSAITPPVALSLIAANGISGAGLWESSVASIRLSLSSYIVPFMFVFTPAMLLIGDYTSIAYACMTSIIGVTALAAGLNGYFLQKTTLLERILLLVVAAAMIKPGLTTDLIGAALLLATIILQKSRGRARLAETVGPGPGE
jgi:TRAP transporter 4TM/12TM fusion protein